MKKLNDKNFVKSQLLTKLNVEHGFLTRNGGFSLYEFQSLNCKLNSIDKTENVKNNLTTVTKLFNLNLNNLTLLKQIHSNKLVVANNSINKIEGDAIISNKKNTLLGVLTADCVPILIWEKINGIALAIHAGWKGALSGIIENAINSLKKYGKCEFYAIIGPCIRQRNYEIDKKLYDLFLNQTSLNKNYFINSTNKNRFLFDLPKYCYDKLIKCNAREIDDLQIDTYSNPNNFFSCRRAFHNDQKHFGCQISVIKL